MQFAKSIVDYNEIVRRAQGDPNDVAVFNAVSAIQQLAEEQKVDTENQSVQESAAASSDESD